MNRTKRVVALAVAAALSVSAQAQRGGTTYVPYNPPPPPRQPPVQVPTPPAEPVSPTVSRAVTPASLEEQVRQLQTEVAELQGIVQALQARMPPDGDTFVTFTSPRPDLRCARTSLTAANDILSRAYSLNDISRRPYPDDTLVIMWAGCRR